MRSYIAAGARPGALEAGNVGGAGLEPPRPLALFFVARADTAGGADDARLEQLAVALHQADVQFKIIKARHRAELETLARRAGVLARRYEGAVVAAGDETIDVVARAAHEARRPYGLLAVGTLAGRSGGGGVQALQRAVYGEPGWGAMAPASTAVPGAGRGLCPPWSPASTAAAPSSSAHATTPLTALRNAALGFWKRVSGPVRAACGAIAHRRTSRSAPLDAPSRRVSASRKR